MKSKKVLLRETLDGVGKVGDIVTVAPGFARNFLYPRGLAIEATADNVRALARKRARYEAEEAARLAEIRGLAAKLEGVRIEVTAKADETGSLYGSVGAATIVEKLAAAGHSVEERAVRLEHPLKSVGEHPVEVHVHGDLNATVTVVIAAEAVETEA